MKTKGIATSFLLLSLVFSLKAQNAYSDRIDSLLVSISNLIFNDLSRDGFKIRQRPWIGFGESFELKVIFDAKRAVFLTYLHRPEALSKKSHKTKLKHQFKYMMFGNYIRDHGELPYGTFEAFDYKFILLQTRGDTLGADALFGEYMLRASPEGLTIIAKRIEALKGEKAIVEKYGSDW